MSRRSDREGVHRSETQRRRNLATWAEQRRRGMNELGWYPPCTIWERWEELGFAQFYIRERLLILRQFLRPHERAEYIRRARICLERARQCPRPQLP